jgi:hypothetical protein
MKIGMLMMANADEDDDTNEGESCHDGREEK